MLDPLSKRESSDAKYYRPVNLLHYLESAWIPNQCDQKPSEKPEVESLMRPRLIVFLAIAAVAVGVLSVTLSPYFPQQPEVRFYTMEQTYRLEQTVEFTLENNHISSVCYGNSGPWSIDRMTAAGWQRVEAHIVLDRFEILRPGKSMLWGWVAEDDPFWASRGLAQVEPGKYRIVFSGALCESQNDDSSVPLQLTAFFTLIA